MKLFHIGGITPFTTIDYPECLSAVFYFKGCVFRCPYCHNKEFLERGEPHFLFSTFQEFIDERRDFLDAIVFSGGEPLLFIDELEFLAGYVKGCGLKVGIHTTGYSPERLKYLLNKNLVDWVGIDLKADRKNYPSASGVKRNFFNKTVKSIGFLKKSGIDFEVRTTVYREIADFDKLKLLFNEYKELGIKHPVLQIYSEKGVVDKSIKAIVEDFLLEANFHATIRG